MKTIEQQYRQRIFISKNKFFFFFFFRVSSNCASACGRMLCETSFYAERYLLGRKSAHAEESLLGRKSAHAEGVLLGSESAYAEGVLHFVELYDRKLSIGLSSPLSRYSDCPSGSATIICPSIFFWNSDIYISFIYRPSILGSVLVYLVICLYMCRILIVLIIMNL